MPPDLNKPHFDIKGSIVFEVDQAVAEVAGFMDLSTDSHLAMVSNKKDSITFTMCGRTFTGMIVKNNISHYPASLSLQVEFRILSEEPTLKKAGKEL